MCAVRDARYYPPPDTQGGWRSLGTRELNASGVDRFKLDETVEYVKTSTKHGGLLVLKDGWLVYERYFGKGGREAMANLASCGKPFTSIAMGILLSERPDMFPDGLDQRVYTKEFLPKDAFPLTDPRKADIKLGQLLAFSAGIRGNNPSYINGSETTIDPAGPDGWESAVDLVAFGKKDSRTGSGAPLTTASLWCEPGGGYSYSSSSIHLVSIIIRHVCKTDFFDFVNSRIAAPLGWGRWGYGYRHLLGPNQTSGGGGIVLRPTDMLRFGYLLLNKGRWDGAQLVPEEYIEHCSRASRYNPHFPYSLQFNVNSAGDYPDIPADAFWKHGSGGHCFYVVPSKNLVVWKLGGRDDQFNPLNTGFADAEDPAAASGEREGWTQTMDHHNTSDMQTLRLVLRSVTG